MSEQYQVTVPDIGDFEAVEVIDVLVKPGDAVVEEASLITLESGKATMDIPAPAAGTVAAVAVNVGDQVSQGSIILTLDVTANPAPPAPASVATPPTQTTVSNLHAEVLVLGSGPGGYTAAFRAADLGKRVVMVERYPSLGGVCLNVGCIPSKALLHAAKVISEAKEMSEVGVEFDTPRIDPQKLGGWKDGVVGQLTSGLRGLAKKRSVEIVEGTGTFTSSHSVDVEHAGTRRTLTFDQAIIAAGSEPARLPNLPDDPRIMDSTGALELIDIPERLLVIGGGIIGLELATVYYEIGSRVTVVELLDELMFGADRDIVKPLQQRIAKQYENIYLGTKVAGVEAKPDGLHVAFEGADAPAHEGFDRVLVAVGRTPNGRNIGAEAAGVQIDERGYVPVDAQQRTNVAHIFAIGDIVGQPMLAHKATHEGKVAAEVAAGEKSAFEATVIPSVAYTDPEVAWAGLTESDAKAQGRAYEKGTFPWAASGRSLSLGRNEGMTKLLFDPATRRVIGAGIVGPNAGDLIAEVALAIEMGSDAEDIGLTVHAHPTLSETVAMAAEAYAGTITDLYIPRR